MAGVAGLLAGGAAATYGSCWAGQGWLSQKAVNSRVEHSEGAESSSAIIYNTHSPALQVLLLNLQIEGQLYRNILCHRTSRVVILISNGIL